MTGAETWLIALIVASRGSRPSSMWCSTASTTTIASSTTMPMASTSPKSVRLLSEKPSAAMTANVPTIGHRHGDQRDQRRPPVLQEQAAPRTRPGSRRRRSVLNTSLTDSVMNGVVS